MLATKLLYLPILLWRVAVDCWFAMAVQLGHKMHPSVHVLSCLLAGDTPGLRCLFSKHTASHRR
jgi:hypothetical protein